MPTCTRWCWALFAVASQQLDTGSALSQDDVIAVLANSFAAHQNRLAGSGDAFEPTKIASVLAALQREHFIEDDGTGLRLTRLGTVVAESGLAVRSAITVAAAFRRAPAKPTQPSHDSSPPRSSPRS